MQGLQAANCMPFQPCAYHSLVSESQNGKTPTEVPAWRWMSWGLHLGQSGCNGQDTLSLSLRTDKTKTTTNAYFKELWCLGRDDRAGLNSPGYPWERPPCPSKTVGCARGSFALCLLGWHIGVFCGVLPPWQNRIWPAFFHGEDTHACKRFQGASTFFEGSSGWRMLLDLQLHLRSACHRLSIASSALATSPLSFSTSTPAFQQPKSSPSLRCLACSASTAALHRCASTFSTL